MRASLGLGTALMCVLAACSAGDPGSDSLGGGTPGTAGAQTAGTGATAQNGGAAGSATGGTSSSSGGVPASGGASGANSISGAPASGGSGVSGASASGGSGASSGASTSGGVTSMGGTPGGGSGGGSGGRMSASGGMGGRASGGASGAGAGGSLPGSAGAAGAAPTGGMCTSYAPGGTGSEAMGQIPLCCSPSAAEKELISEVFRLLNAHRTANGLAALAYDEKLEAAIQGHCRHMAEHTFFAHEAPEAVVTSPWDRAEACGAAANGENIARGQRSAADVMAAWTTSEGHNRNMLGNFGRVGIGYVASGRYWGQLFGR